MTTSLSLQQDLNKISSTLYHAFEIPPFKRDYDKVFEEISRILRRYGIDENNRNLRFRFILCMQEFFDALPPEEWKIKDPSFIKESEEFAINKFKEWVTEQIT